MAEVFATVEEAEGEGHVVGCLAIDGEGGDAGGGGVGGVGSEHVFEGVGDAVAIGVGFCAAGEPVAVAGAVVAAGVGGEAGAPVVAEAGVEGGIFRPDADEAGAFAVGRGWPVRESVIAVGEGEDRGEEGTELEGERFAAVVEAVVGVP